MNSTMKRKSADDGEEDCDCSYHTDIIDVSGRDISFFGDGYDVENKNDDDCCQSAISNFFQQHINSNFSYSNITAERRRIALLNFSQCRLGPEGTSNLFSFLSSKSKSSIIVKQIDLQRNAIGSIGGRALGTFLLQNVQPHCTCIDISLNDLKSGEEGFVGTAASDASATLQISNGLATNKTITTLRMNKCAIGPTGATHLANAIRVNTTLQILHLEGNMFGPIGGEKLFDAFQVNTSLKEVGLRMNRIGGSVDKADVRSLTCALMSNKQQCQLCKLDLSYNDLRCLGCIILAEAIGQLHCPLRELILEKNDIGGEGAVALANALALGGGGVGVLSNKNGCSSRSSSNSGSCSKLHSLVLRGNAIGNVGAVALGTMLKHNDSLNVLDISSCSIDNEGGAAIGLGLSENSTIETLNLDKNSLGYGGRDYSLFSMGVSSTKSLLCLHLSGNGFTCDDHQLDGSLTSSSWGEAVSTALSTNTSLRYLDLSNNALSEGSIIDAIASHPCITKANMSDNEFESISIETQLKLAERMVSMEIDLSFNALSSPPLGRLADCVNLKRYLTLLASEKISVTRIRLMVCGHGGSGKTTFSRAITSESDQSDFQASLLPVDEWGKDRLTDWASRLGTVWSDDAARLISDECLTGKDLAKFVNTDIDGSTHPTDILLSLCSSKYQSIETASFARAISSLRAKGYFSTVGVVKVDGTVPIGNDRTCSLVDFAGQSEFLVSHQLLLSSLHTLCIIIQPAPSFQMSDPNHSWQYWRKFLSSLGDRRQGSLLLAISQLDKVQDGKGSNFDSEDIISNEFKTIKEQSFGTISCEAPLRLDYRPEAFKDTVYRVKQALTKSTNDLAHSWWVPNSYEILSKIIAQDVAQRKASNHELPILTRDELILEIKNFCEQSPQSSVLLLKLTTDSQLLQKAIEYMEAVGDVMQAGDQLLIDPIGWFPRFLSHFIKDDLAVTTIQIDNLTLRRQRGVVYLDDIIRALAHEYVSPREHITQIVELMCRLELCVPLCKKKNSFLFPCLLPYLSSNKELLHEGLLKNSNLSVVRGHRFRESNGFIPPGLFLGIVARLFQKLAPGVMHPTRMWKDHVVLCVNNEVTRILIKCNLDESIIDVVAFAPSPELLFVGAAKGQASIVIWIVHLLKIFMRNYSQLKFGESWMCTNSRCHRILGGRYSYQGSEFPVLSRDTKRTNKAHDCNTEGCWRFLGVGHSVGAMQLSWSGLSGSTLCCEACGKSQVFTLRDKVDEKLTL